MIPIGLLILGIALILIAVLAWSKEKSYGDYTDRFYVAILSGIGLLLTSVLMLSICYVMYVGSNARLSAFYEASKSNYVYAIDETDSVLTISQESLKDTLIAVEGSVEKLQVGDAVTQRIAEYRDAVNQYNSDLAYVRAMDSNFLVGVMYATPDENLKLIAIK